MNVIALPSELSNLVIDDSNVEHLRYKLSYFHANDCINKDPDDNAALQVLERYGAIGDESDSIYEKFIPIAKANLLREKESLGYSVNIMDYDYPDHYIVSEDTYRKWWKIINFEQKIDYKIRSLIELHDVEGDKISAVMNDCENESLEPQDKAYYQLSLLMDIWDKNYYAVSDDNIVWGVGYSEIDAFFDALENHLWLEKIYGTEAVGIDLEGTVPYLDTTDIFARMLELMLSKEYEWDLPNNLNIQPCSRLLFDKQKRDGLMEYDFCEERGLLDLVR